MNTMKPKGAFRREIKRTGAMLTALLVMIGIVRAQGQPNGDLAREKCSAAIALMDEGQVAESIKVLEECLRLDPQQVNCRYEMAYAQYLNKNYPQAIAILRELTSRSDARDIYFLLLGNSYDMAGHREEAIRAYESGLKHAPTSGRLYAELGAMYAMVHDYSKALEYHEKGIEADPQQPANYYWAARIFLESTEEVWGMIYGEIFMNLERTTARTGDMSKRLYDTYQQQIQFIADTAIAISFSEATTVDMSKRNPSLPFGVGIYEPLLATELVKEKSLRLDALDRIRTGFIRQFFENRREEKYPNILFTYQRQLLDAGHLEAYNHWLLSKGEPEAFARWQIDNPKKWTAFIAWYQANPIQITQQNKFLRAQY